MTMSVLVAACVIGMAGRSAEATSVTALNLEGSAIYDIAKAIPGLQTLGYPWSSQLIQMNSGTNTATSLPPWCFMYSGLTCDTAAGSATYGSVIQLDISCSQTGVQMTGTIPKTISTLTNLNLLYFCGNKLAGSIPSTMGSLTNLVRLAVDGNQLTGSIPSSLGGLVLMTFAAFSNNLLVGTIPSSFGLLTSLITLNAYSTSLSGTIPTTFNQLTLLSVLDLHNNLLTMGSVATSVPTSTFSSSTLLNYMDLSCNHLTFTRTKPNGCCIVSSTATTTTGTPSLTPTPAPTAAPKAFAVDFLRCSGFVLNAETAITFGGVSTTLVGDIGIAPGTAITGQFTNGPTDIVHYTDTAAANCAADFKNIDVKAAGASPCVSIASELGGKTLQAGIFCTPPGAFMLSTGLTLNLDGNYDQGSEFIFIAASTFISLPYTFVKCINLASPGNVYWSIGSSATIGDYSTMVGNIIAYASITFNSFSTLYGRGLAGAAITCASGSTLTLALQKRSATTPTAAVTSSPSTVSLTTSPTSSAGTTSYGASCQETTTYVSGCELQYSYVSTCGEITSNEITCEAT